MRCARPTVYYALEGAEGFKARVEAFRREKMAEAANGVAFFLSPTPLNLVADHQALAASIRAKLGPLAPACIVVDTVDRSLAGSESDDRDMGAYIKAADALRDAFACLALVVHHSGVDASRPRGHTSLAGAVDAQLAVKKDGEVVVITLERTKDGPEGETVASRLVSVVIGMDADKPNVARGAGIMSFGEPLPDANGIPRKPRAVKAASWREALFTRGVLDRDAKNPREDFARIRRALLVKHLAGERDGLVWPV